MSTAPPSAGTIQVCFLIDSTGSMQPHIDNVRTSIKGIAAQVHIKYPGFVIQVGVVAYKDHGIAPTTFEFTDELQEFENHVAAIKCDGGGDVTEDVESGLKAALAMKWEARHRIVFHIADAPSHGKFYYIPGRAAMDATRAENYDTLPTFDPTGEILAKLICEFQRKAINFAFLQICKETKKMEEHFQTIYNRERNSKNLPFKVAPIDTNPASLFDNVASFILTSIAGNANLSMPAITGRT